MGYVGAKPSAVPLTSADITDGIITNADIANSTINLTTKVTGSLPVANGGTGLTALGTASQELRVNSGATALEYYTPTVASSDFVKLATTAITANTASVSFDGYFSSTYKNYIFIGSHLKNDASDSLRMRYRQSNADVTSSNYVYAQKTHRVNGGAVDDSNGEITTSIKISGTNTVASERTINFQFYLFDPLNTSYYKNIAGTGHNIYVSSGTYYYFHQFSGIFVGNTTALSGITFFMGSGNLDDGSISLYGIKH